MEEILDALRRVIYRWVNTTTPVTQDIPIGSDIVNVITTLRFQPGDMVALTRPALPGEIGPQYEQPTGFAVAAILSDTQLQLNQPVQTNWYSINSPQLVKTPGGFLLQGIYIGDPDLIDKYPAIVVNGVSNDSKWMTLSAVKTTWNVEIGVYVEASTYEAGYRYMLQTADIIATGLAANIVPLVNDYNMCNLTQNALASDTVIQVSDPSIFCPGQIIFVECPFYVIENQILSVDTSANTVTLTGPIGQNFNVSDGSIAIQPHRIIYNSYPRAINYGKVSKGTMLKAAVIDWFGEEQVINPTMRGGGLNGGRTLSDTFIK